MSAVELTRCDRCEYALVKGVCPICPTIPLDVTPGQFISPGHYGAWMRGHPIRAGRTRWKIPPRWRELIMQKAQWQCEECHTRSDVQVEHIVPVAFGGSNEPCNLTALCGTHNRERWSPQFRELLERAEAAA